MVFEVTNELHNRVVEKKKAASQWIRNVRRRVREEVRREAPHSNTTPLVIALPDGSLHHGEVVNPVLPYMNSAPDTNPDSAIDVDVDDIR